MADRWLLKNEVGNEGMDSKGVWESMIIIKLILVVTLLALLRDIHTEIMQQETAHETDDTTTDWDWCWWG